MVKTKYVYADLNKPLSAQEIYEDMLVHKNDFEYRYHAVYYIQCNDCKAFISSGRRENHQKGDCYNNPVVIHRSPRAKYPSTEHRLDMMTGIMIEENVRFNCVDWLNQFTFFKQEKEEKKNV